MPAVSYRPDDPRAKLGSGLLRDLGQRETPERRTGPRFHAPTLDVRLGRNTYQTIDWGLGALVIGGFTGSVKLGSKVSLTLSLASDPDVTHRATARVLRLDAKKHCLTLQFVEIGKGLLGWLGDLQMTGV